MKTLLILTKLKQMLSINNKANQKSILYSRLNFTKTICQELTENLRLPHLPSILGHYVSLTYF